MNDAHHDPLLIAWQQLDRAQAHLEIGILGVERLGDEIQSPLLEGDDLHNQCFSYHTKITDVSKRLGNSIHALQGLCDAAGMTIEKSGAYIHDNTAKDRAHMVVEDLRERLDDLGISHQKYDCFLQAIPKAALRDCDAMTDYLVDAEDRYYRLMKDWRTCHTIAHEKVLPQLPMPSPELHDSSPLSRIIKQHPLVKRESMLRYYSDMSETADCSAKIIADALRSYTLDAQTEAQKAYVLRSAFRNPSTPPEEIVALAREYNDVATNKLEAGIAQLGLVQETVLQLQQKEKRSPIRIGNVALTSPQRPSCNAAVRQSRILSHQLESFQKNACLLNDTEALPEVTSFAIKKLVKLLEDIEDDTVTPAIIKTFLSELREFSSNQHQWEECVLRGTNIELNASTERLQQLGPSSNTNKPEGVIASWADRTAGQKNTSPDNQR